MADSDNEVEAPGKFLSDSSSKITNLRASVDAIGARLAARDSRAGSSGEHREPMDDSSDERDSSDAEVLDDDDESDGGELTDEKREQLREALVQAQARVARAVASAEAAEARAREAEAALVVAELHLACCQGDTAKCDQILKTGVAPDHPARDGATPLLSACIGGHAGVAKLLLQGGADVDVPRRKGAGGRSAGSLHGAETVVRVLRWHDAIAARPAVQRGVAVLAENQRRGTMTDAEREIMFGKTQFAAR